MTDELLRALLHKQAITELTHSLIDGSRIGQPDGTDPGYHFFRLLQRATARSA